MGRNTARGREAIAKALETQADVLDAMEREEAGSIDFIWGSPGDPDRNFEGGSGISHVVAKHGEAAARRIPEIISEGDAGKPYSERKRGARRINIYLGGERVVLQANGAGEKAGAWIVTSYASDEQG